MTSTRPVWASGVTSPTRPAAVKPRATRSRKNASQPAQTPSKMFVPQ
jgi:hypothetical protein